MPRTGEGQNTAPLLLLSVLGMLVAAAGLDLRRRIKAKED
jgi:LPXTG-motif cell wall-anchored protein